ncbi:HEPN domain-containing protein [Bacillus cereus]|uniref:HEPN domain-containing protein n=3 Tax=Bacillus TaxID=1386 RepID=UPI001F579FE8|nr:MULTISPECIES: HEPN domain-containing protein [unclassified Bacillus cereus group]MDA1834947.1 HEPN domain-containing protein [Bacillus cereus group sp. BY142LC]MDA2733280.1 HEPN domain-containing protein [Bacillus cereus]
MQQPVFADLETEILNIKSYLIERYLNMLDPNHNPDKDALELLDEFIAQFTEGPEKGRNYIEYMIFLRSYILLCHAAIEEFIEQTAKYYFEESIKLYNSSKNINSILKWFILKSEFNNKKFTDKNFDEIIKDLKDDYFQSINENHGIKRHNLEKIFFKIGIEDISFEVFESLGEMRGKFAHHNGKSAHLSLKLEKPLNPQDCVKLVSDVLKLIKDEIIDVLSEELV